MQRSQVVRGGFYNRLNPPKSKKDADARLDILDREIAIIENKINLSLQRDGQTKEEHEFWKQRVGMSLAYFTTERDYLLRWIRNDETSDMNNIPLDVSATFLEIEREMQKVLSSEECAHTELYSAGKPIPSEDQVWARRIKLNSLMDQLEKNRQIFKNLLHSRGITDSIFLNKINQEFMRRIFQVKTEQRYLRPYAKSGTRMGPVLFLLTLVERAVSEGFALTTDEYTQFETLKMSR